MFVLENEMVESKFSILTDGKSVSTGSNLHFIIVFMFSGQ